LYVNPDQVKKEFENLIDPVMKQSLKLSALRKKEIVVHESSSLDRKLGIGL
jgi:hypothetical protein